MRWHGDPRWIGADSDDRWPARRILACLARSDFGPSDLPLSVWLGVCGLVVLVILSIVAVVAQWK